MLILSLRHGVPFFYGYELLETSCDITDLLHVKCIYHETGSVTPVGNTQLHGLNVALLYSWVYYMMLKWIEKDTNISAIHALK